MRDHSGIARRDHLAARHLFFLGGVGRTPWLFRAPPKGMEQGA